MQVELSGEVFEWLLADWAGLSEKMSDDFSDLLENNHTVLAEELALAIRQAHLEKKVI